MSRGYGQPTVGDMGMILAGNSQAQLSVSAAAAETSVFVSEGYFDIWCDVDVYIKVGETGTDVTTSNGYLLRANTTLANVVVKQGQKIGAIAGGAGTLRYHQVS